MLFVRLINRYKKECAYFASFAQYDRVSRVLVFFEPGSPLNTEEAACWVEDMGISMPQTAAEAVLDAIASGFNSERAAKTVVVDLRISRTPLVCGMKVVD